MMTPLGMVPSLGSPNMACISCFKPCYFVWYSISIITVWHDWKWCRREFRRHGQRLQLGKEVFNAYVRRWKCINFQKDWLADCSRSPYFTAMLEFYSAGNWNLNSVPCLAAVVDLEFWSILSFAIIVKIPILNVWGKNAPSLLYWDIIQFTMSLVSSNKLLMEEIYQRRNTAN